MKFEFENFFRKHIWDIYSLDGVCGQGQSLKVKLLSFILPYMNLWLLFILMYFILSPAEIERAVK